MSRLCFSDQKLYLTPNSIFLAGPTRRDSPYEKSWRKEAVRLLEENPDFDGTIYIPELYEFRPFGENEIEEQTRWEWKCLDASGIIVFWVPRTMPDMPAFTTNVEFGIYTEKKPDQIILGYPAYAEKMRYLEKRYKDVTGKKACQTLKKTLAAAVELLNERNYNEN